MWLLALAAVPILVLPILAMIFVEYAFGRWGGVQNRVHLSGMEIAAHIKRTVDLTPVVETTTVGDHYDPRSHTVRLTEKVAHQQSVLALAIVAHELGHAEQHQDNPAMIRLRNVLIPAIQISPSAAYATVLIGMTLRMFRLIWVGAAIFALVVVFMFLTLPIEIDASRRGMRLLRASGLLETEDRRGVQQVLSAAALTYVSASVLSLGQLLRYIRLARLG
jgi:uncharacterized protein